MKHLICEGVHCNPNLRSTDDLVKREVSINGRVMLGISDVAVMALRRLVYTPHEMEGPSMARCTECQHLRQYGN
jgi:hypothetical protein